MGAKIGPHPEPLTFVHPKDIALIEKYREHFHNTGGNDPADLLNDLYGKDEHMMSTNIVRFTLAVSIQSQMGLLRRLEDQGLLR